MASCLLHFFHGDLDHGVEYEVEPELGIRIIRVTTLDGAEQPFSPALWGEALGTIARFIDPESGWNDGWGEDDDDEDEDEDDE